MVKGWRVAVSIVVSGALAGCAGGPTFAELFDDSAAGEGTGFQGAALVRAVVILARHQATPRQRQVAQQNAERAVARLERQIAAESKAPAPKSKARTAKHVSIPPKKRTATGTAPKPEPPEEPAEKPAPKVAKAPPKKKLPARIAVRTVKEDSTAPKARAAVMIYDVQARRIVGNEVYDIEQEPRPDETVKFDTSVVRYVGATAY